MKIIECEGSPRSLGEQTGEALREQIREHISLRPMRDWPAWERRAPLFLEGHPCQRKFKELTL